MSNINKVSRQTFSVVFNMTRNGLISNSKTFSSHPSNNDKDVRVRFAPSPTGQLHLGSIRTALYNYLFAKSRGGKFILRIEDTDQSRLVSGAMKQLEYDLKWIGLTTDEGPSVGGDYGPYIQSERLGLYKEAVEEMLDRKAAYRCFCTDYRLDLLRKDSLRRRQVPRYDNRCRHIDPESAKKRALDGERHCIRFKMDGIEGLKFHDLVYGSISYGSDEGDPVILKADGFPTYHLANIVDDHHMCISHVLRGVEWQISTPKHILMYRALDWTPPLFAHLPLILNSDGSKLSKRQGDIQVNYYREDGIFPGALLNYVTDAGGGFRNRDKTKSLTIDELVSHFDLGLIGTNSCRLRPDRLGDFNRMEIKRLLKNEESSKKLVQMLQSMIKEKFQRSDDELELGELHIRRILLWGVDRIHAIKDLVSPEFAFLWVLPSSNAVSSDEDVFMKITGELTKIPDKEFTKDKLKSRLRCFAEEHGLPFGQTMKLIRKQITGLKEGPGVPEMLDVLGKDSSLARLRRVLQKS
ncbi:probable glutamate--tRNA ligase, mitochondrial isoform X2 [Ischnura elegans]|uniref:probable glutamate--tRNA ligase, mitochondrial isoform X2 n=1 Tax=Ischnura elegans TaxID=197161 RepID=UPI001ED870AB|nr:probable glutamate--tRNA ligase, mitochondrial isoform X2 [Ischnura elegans]